MKWKCTYSTEEKEEATADLAVLLQRHPGAKVRRDKSKAPKLAVYVTIGKALDPSPRSWYNCILYTSAAADE